MTKKDLQKELLEKVKPGTKPSDIKKTKPIKPKSEEKDEGYSSEELSEEENIIVPIVPTSNQEIKNLQTKITALERQLQTYKDFKEADLKIKEKYKQEIEQWKKAVEKANTLITDKEQIIKELQQENKEQYKTISDMKSKGENPTNIKPELFNCYNCKKQQKISLLVLEIPQQGKLCQPCWQVFRKKTKELQSNPQNTNPKPQTFICVACEKEKNEVISYKKIDIPYKPHLIKGKEYPVCASCSPYVKEYNEHEDQEFSIGED